MPIDEQKFGVWLRFDYISLNLNILLRSLNAFMPWPQQLL